MSRKWTIGVTYPAMTDTAKIRASSVYHVEADDIAAAIAIARADLGLDYKLGTIMPGHHATLHNRA